MVEINVADLIKKSSDGVKKPKLDILLPFAFVRPSIPRKADFVPEELGEQSLLGTPFFMPCKLDDFQLPNEPIIELIGGNRIVKTEVDGMDGTFKELWSKNDYEITIRGIITQEDGTERYPDQAVRQLRNICEKKSAVDIVNALTGFFGIKQMAIERWEFPAIEGGQSMQPYVITASSDTEFDIELKS